MDEEAKACLENSVLQPFLYFLNLLGIEEDPLTRYYKNWAWHHIDVPSGEEFIEPFGAPERHGWYWKKRLARRITRAVTLAKDKQSPEEGEKDSGFVDLDLFANPEAYRERINQRAYQKIRAKNKLFLGADLEKYVTQFKLAMDDYVEAAETWVASRLELENQLFDCSLDMKLFHRDLTAELIGIEPDFMGCAGRRFILNYWEDILTALGRYFKVLETQRQKVLTKSRHRDNLKLALKLKKSLDHTLQDLPDYFEPEYEYLSKKLGAFVEAPVSELTPKRDHDKAARQVLIRELFTGWHLCSSNFNDTDPPISPEKHVFNLVRAVDQDISLSIIYREYKHFNASERLISYEE